MTKYIYKVSQAIIFSFLFLQVADWFGYSFSLYLKEYFYYVVLPVCLLVGFVWSAVNRSIIKGYIFQWRDSKKRWMDGNFNTRLSFLAYLQLFVKDLINFSVRFIFNFYNLTLILIMMVFFDIFAINLYSGFITAAITFYWIWILLKNRLEGRYSVLLALIVLPLCPLLNQMSSDFKAEKSGIWVFIFLSIGVIRLIWEESRLKTNYRHIEEMFPAVKTVYSRLRHWIQHRYEIELAKENDRLS